MRWHKKYDKKSDEWIFIIDNFVFLPQDRKNKLQVVVSPVEDDAVTINQDAWFSLGNLDKGFKTDYTIKKKGNGVYAFLIEGAVTINGQKLEKRDGMGIWDTEKLEIVADANSEILLIDVPMTI